MDIRLNIDPSRCGGRIAEKLFGCNVEVTRLGVWRGLSAEMVNNRKFAAFDEHDMPLRWAIAGDRDKVKVDRTFGYAGNRSLLISGKECGVAQTSEVLTFSAEKQYNIRLVAFAAGEMPLTVRVISPADERVIFHRKWQCIPGRWETFSGGFLAENDYENCRVEIVSSADTDCHIGAVSIQPADAFFGMRREVVEIFKELQLPSLRYPGGCYAEFFRWQDSVLPVDQRPAVGPTGLPFLLPENDDFDPVEIGLDEFMELCRFVGAEPAVTVRMSEVPPSDAAELVEYCNGAVDTVWGGRRAANGHAEPYGIKYWFLGNELWSFGRGGLNDPAVCAAKSAEFAAAMRRVDPSIHLTGCSFYAQEHWNKPLQEIAGKFLDEYSMHDYLLDHFKKKDDLEAIAKAATTELRPYLQRVRDSLLAGMPENKFLTIALDEWNLRWGLVGSAAMGLYVAGVLNLLCREAAELHITRGYYFMAVNEGIVRVRPDTAYLDASGLMFDLFRCHRNGRLLLLPEVADEADIDYCASLDTENKVVSVTLINRNMQENREVSFAFPAGCRVAFAGCRGYEPERLVPECEKFRAVDFEVKNGTDAVVLSPGQVVCCRFKFV